MGKLTLQLTEDHLDRLKRRAERLGSTPERVAEEMVEAGIAAEAEPDELDDETRRRGEEATRELQEAILQLYGGVLPGNMVDTFLAERRQEWGEE